MKKKPNLIIAAGKGCFTNCKGCYQFFGKNLVQTEDILKFIYDYRKKFEIPKLTLAGGDPMTRRDIIYMINGLQNLNIPIYMDTVGKNFVRKSKIIFNDVGYAEYVSPILLKDKVEKIGIPVDGYTTKQINAFRRGITLDETLEILNELNKCNLNICINTVVNKNNINDLKEIYKLINKYENIVQWQLFQYSPIGDLGFKNRKLFEINQMDFLKKIKELLNNNDSKIIIEGKSNSYRKLNYILVNSDGYVWFPNYNLSKSTFIDEDSNSDKKIIGSIYDNDIFEKIDTQFAKINKVKESDSALCKVIR